MRAVHPALITQLEFAEYVAHVLLQGRHYAYAVHPSNEYQVIRVGADGPGYTPCMIAWSPKAAQELCRLLNHTLGQTELGATALLARSLFGDVPGAKPNRIAEISLGLDEGSLDRWIG